MELWPRALADLAQLGRGREDQVSRDRRVRTRERAADVPRFVARRELRQAARQADVARRQLTLRVTRASAHRPRSDTRRGFVQSAHRSRDARRELRHAYDDDITAPHASLRRTNRSHRKARPCATPDTLPAAPHSAPRSSSPPGRRSRARRTSKRRPPRPPPRRSSCLRRSRPRRRRSRHSSRKRPTSTITRSTPPATSSASARASSRPRCRRSSSRWWCSTSPSTLQGNVTRAAVWRSNGYEDLERIALASVKRAGKLPAPSPEVLKGQESVRFLETWLFRHDGRYHVRSVVPADLPTDEIKDLARNFKPAKRRLAAAPASSPDPTARALPGRFVFLRSRSRCGPPLIIGVPSIRPERGAHTLIDLYTWPTPNGHKIHIMLEESGLAVQRAPDRHRRRRPIQARVPEDLPEQQDAGDRRPGRSGRRAARDLRIRRHPVLSGRQDRASSSRRRPRPLDGDAMADVPDGQHRPDARPGAPLPRYAPQNIEYAINRYKNEANRLYGVLDRRLGESPTSPARTTRSPTSRSCPGPASGAPGRELAEYPNVRAGSTRSRAPGGEARVQVLADRRRTTPLTPEQREVMFGALQYARR